MELRDSRRSFDDAMDALGDVQRRKLLLALLEHNPENDAPDLPSGSIGETDAVERRTMMKHVHMPKLDAYGFVEWDEDAHEVVKGENFVEIKPLLQLLDDNRNELPSGWL
jgi:hypothetical protein